MLLIEGIGGIMVPLDERRTVLDLMSMLRIPIILVAGSYVGTISHTLTALEVLARRNLNVAGVVVSESEGSAASLADTVASLAHFADAIDVVGIPRLAPDAPEHPAFAQIAALISIPSNECFQAVVLKLCFVPSAGPASVPASCRSRCAGPPSMF